MSTMNDNELDTAGAHKEDTGSVDHSLWATLIIIGATLAGIVACWDMFLKL